MIGSPPFLTHPTAQDVACVIAPRLRSLTVRAHKDAVAAVSAIAAEAPQLERCAGDGRRSSLYTILSFHIHT